MADLKTTAESRQRLRDLARTDDDVMYARDILTENVLADLDTLLAEDAKLRAVAEEARAFIDAAHLSPAEDAAYRTLDAALAALEAP